MQVCKILIALIAGLSFLSPIITFILNHYLQIAGPSQWLALSRWGLLQGWVWQPFTYFLIHTAGTGIQLGFLISLAFYLYLLWFTGSEIARRYGGRSFLFFFLGGGIVAGLVSAAALLLTGSDGVVVGSTPPLFALITVWGMLYYEADLYFFVLRVKARTLVAAFLGISLLMHLSEGAFILCLADLVGIAWGLLIGRYIWNLPR